MERKEEIEQMIIDNLNSDEIIDLLRGLGGDIQNEYMQIIEKENINEIQYAITGYIDADDERPNVEIIYFDKDLKTVKEIFDALIIYQKYNTMFMNKLDIATQILLDNGVLCNGIEGMENLKIVKMEKI